MEEFFNRIFPIENITAGYKGKEMKERKGGKKKKGEREQRERNCICYTIEEEPLERNIKVVDVTG